MTDATFDAGFSSTSRMYETFRLPGMAPSTYGRGGAGAGIDWFIAATPVGRVLVAATPKGLCFVEVGPAAEALVETLRSEFPHAAIAPDPSPALEPLARAVAGVVEGVEVTASLPVDVQGTAFQWRVWRALTSIPAGETRSYAELAQMIGAPRAVRAVARACATNRLALVVPCHRVVGTDGSLRGYRWGLDVKRELIARERRRNS